MGEARNGYDSSSGEEDGDATWRAAIESVAGTTTIYLSSSNNGKSASKSSDDDDDEQWKPKNHQFKHYQIKAQRLLNDVLEDTLEIVKQPFPILDEDPNIQEGGIRLFKHSQPGIVFDHVDEPQPPRKRPRILPGEDIDERSKKFKWQIHSVAVDGRDIIASAEDAYQKALARLEAKDAAVKAAAQREKERVENLKKVRGERWLPSMARDMQLGYKC